MIANPVTDLWTFDSDLTERRRLFHVDVFSHPAKFHLGLLRRLVETYTNVGDTILDPMAGSGSLLLGAFLLRNVILRDLQSEYVELMRKSETILRRGAGMFCGCIDIGQADARSLTGVRCTHMIFSPPYGFETGNGISNERRARILAEKKHGDRWKRYIEHPNHASFAAGFRYAGGQNNIGNKSGRSYWADMRQVYERCAELLSPGGLLILVIKNHWRRGKLIDVVGQTVDLVTALGLALVARHARFIDNPSLWQRRRREQGLPIVDVEDVLVFQKGAK